MYKIEYLQTAKDDMDTIVKYISDNLKNPTSAIKLVNDFIKEINNIVIFPYGNNEYLTYKKLKNKYRKAKVRNYLIFYIVNEQTKTIIIARVLYQKKNIKNILY